MLAFAGMLMLIALLGGERHPDREAELGYAFGMPACSALQHYSGGGPLGLPAGPPRGRTDWIPGGEEEAVGADTSWRWCWRLQTLGGEK